jgi:hypothetical protein
MTFKLMNVTGVGTPETSGRELACSLVISELLATLVKQNDLTTQQVRHILWSAGMRLSDIRSHLDETRSTAHGEKIERDGQHLLNLIEADVDRELRRFYGQKRN